jgi:hypothetical protein
MKAEYAVRIGEKRKAYWLSFIDVIGGHVESVSSFVSQNTSFRRADNSKFIMTPYILNSVVK